MRRISKISLISIALAGCASYDIRDWNPDTQTGNIVVYTGEDMFSRTTEKDAREALLESGRCPGGYDIRELGLRGGGWVTPATETVPVTTTSSINVGGRDVVSVTKTEGSDSGDSTVVGVGEYQTQGNNETDFHTIVRSPAAGSESSGEMWGRWFAFRCK